MIYENLIILNKLVRSDIKKNIIKSIIFRKFEIFFMFSLIRHN